MVERTEERLVLDGNDVRLVEARVVVGHDRQAGGLMERVQNIRGGDLGPRSATGSRVWIGRAETGRLEPNGDAGAQRRVAGELRVGHRVVRLDDSGAHP